MLACAHAAEQTHQGMVVHGFLLLVFALCLCVVNHDLHLNLLASNDTGRVGTCHIAHDILLEPGSLFSQGLSRTGRFKLLIALDLAIDLNWGAQAEHHLEIADILAKHGAVDRYRLIIYDHRVHVVLVGKEIQAVDVVVSCPQAITEAG